MIIPVTIPCYCEWGSGIYCYFCTQEVFYIWLLKKKKGVTFRWYLWEVHSAHQLIESSPLLWGRGSTVPTSGESSLAHHGPATPPPLLKGCHWSVNNTRLWQIPLVHATNVDFLGFRHSKDTGRWCWMIQSIVSFVDVWWQSRWYISSTLG